jgi:hypothetical protein
MELCRSSKLSMFVTIKHDVIHAYLSYNITANPPPQRLACNASLREMPGKEYICNLFYKLH